MKYLLLLCLVFSVLASAQPNPKASSRLQERIESEFGIINYPEIGSCRYELVGKGLALDFIDEDETMELATCTNKAKLRLHRDQRGYSKVLIKHQSQENWIVFEKKM